MKAKGFNRRVYTSPKEMISAIKDILEHAPDLKAASRSGEIDKAFSEKIMLAVTKVNGCRYCNYGHTRAALKEGVSEDEIARIAKGELGEFPKDEAVALMYAQHYAESAGNPDPEATKRFVEYYGEEKARYIMAYIRMIMWGNLMGNTFDAVLSRFKGNPCENSTLCSELGVLGLTVVGFIPFSAAFMYKMAKRPG